MAIAFMFWGCSILFVLVVALILCMKIEASGVKRWGATGSLFSYEKKEAQ
ncbi:hypothetical protein [Anaeroselena agilis]|uniref:ATP synthase F0 subunit 8 n=1 Tax=Anaeroselena agilis TaxID=3063788 RepID=A0ABU3P2A7_9FIRM|nr:hypothetical protein [Selenomonadales bacterium 4137-cl]